LDSSTPYTPPDFPTEGERVYKWLRACVRQTKGRFARKPLELEPWERDFVDELYRFDPETGRRLYQEAHLLIPKKNGKSTLASGLGLYQLAADGEDAPEVYVAAGSRDQAKVVHEQSKAMVFQSPRLLDFLRPFQYHIACPRNGGIFRVLASDARLQHGVNPSTSIIDEKWAHKSNDLIVALAGGTGARLDPITLTISTVGHDLDSPLGTDVVNALKTCELEWRNDGFLLVGRDLDAGFLLWYYTPPFDLDAAKAGQGFHYDEALKARGLSLDDPEVWARCNPASWITEDYLRRRHKLSRPSDFLRFHLNVWAEAEDLWLPQGAWAALAHDGLAIPEHAPVYLGVDIGLKRDTAAITVVHRTGETDDGEPTFDADALILVPPGDGRSLDLGEVRAAIRELARQYDVREVAYDPWTFTESAQQLADEGLPMVEFPMRNELMCPASQALYDVIVGERLRHNGDADFAAHVNAGATTETERGWRLTKRKATKPIDALIALVMAVARATAGEDGSVYDERGIATI
jgi:phage terminase large subunit-like protein